MCVFVGGWGSVWVDRWGGGGDVRGKEGGVEEGDRRRTSAWGGKMVLVLGRGNSGKRLSGIVCVCEREREKARERLIDWIICTLHTRYAEGEGIAFLFSESRIIGESSMVMI